MFFQMLQIFEELGRERCKFMSYYALSIYLQIGSLFYPTVTSTTLKPLKCVEVFGKPIRVSISARTRGDCDPNILPNTHRHTTREVVSLILWKFPNTGWCVDWLKREKRRREEMMGKEGKMSSSIKSPYVYSLSSILHPGVRAGQAQV